MLLLGFFSVFRKFLEGEWGNGAKCAYLVGAWSSAFAVFGVAWLGLNVYLFYFMALMLALFCILCKF